MENWFRSRMPKYMFSLTHYTIQQLFFEGIRCYNTPNGSAIFRLPEHVDRFFNSAKLYGMKIRYTKKQITAAIIKTVKASGLKECYIRPIAYYGYGVMGLTPTLNKVDVSISCWEWKMGESKAGKFSGAKCKISKWVRIDSRSQPMQAKSAANYSNAALARVEALKNGYDEAIMLNYNGKIAEGSAENIFIVKNGIIKTPPLNADILNGITRDSVIQLIKADRIKLTQKNITLNELLKADEVFMTGTAAEVKSVTKINKKSIGKGNVGKITKMLQKSFIDVVMGYDDRFTSWLRYI